MRECGWKLIHPLPLPFVLCVCLGQFQFAREFQKVQKNNPTQPNQHTNKNNHQTDKSERKDELESFEDERRASHLCVYKVRYECETRRWKAERKGVREGERISTDRGLIYLSADDDVDTDDC